MSYAGPTGAAGGEAFRWFCVAGGATTSDRFVELRGMSVQSAEIRSQRNLLRSGTLTKMRVYLRAAFAVANVTFTLRKNGVDTGITGTINAGNQTLNLSGTVSYSPNDFISIKIVQSTSEANATMGATVVVY